MAAETKLVLETYRAKNLLRDLIVQRTIGEHEFPYGMRFIRTDERGLPYSGPVTVDEKDVYRVDIDSAMPLITSNVERKKANFELRRHHWGAGGAFPVLTFDDHSTWVAALYRDSSAPSWPDTYTTASGLSHLIDGVPEPVETTSSREFEEELVFLDMRDLFSGFRNEEGKISLAWNQNRLEGKKIDDRKTLIEVYKDGKRIETTMPYAIGWGTDKDYVTTVVHAYVMYPQGDYTIGIPSKDLFLLNGEVVRKPDSIDFFSRQVALLSLDDMRQSKQEVRTVHYRTSYDDDMMSIEKSERSLEGIKMTEPLRAAMDKTLKMPEDEFQTHFG